MRQPLLQAGRGGYFALALVVLIADQATKVLAHHYLPGRAAIEVVPKFFSLVYSRNRGGLFGYFGDLPDPWRTVLLTLLPVLAVGMIAAFLGRTAGIDRRTLLGLALILGGATGNLIDRIVRGEVVDFLDVYTTDSSLADWFVRRFGTSHWPTFNLADSAIVVGAGLLLITILRPPQPDIASAEPPAAAES